jgi:hypothetical protein
MRFTTRQAVGLISLSVLLSYVILVAFQIDQQTVPDYAAFYAVAKALVAGGLGASHHLYSLRFQVAAESFLSRGPGRTYVEPFVALPPAAWAVIPFTWLSLWPSFYLWDAVCLGLCVIGTFWLVRQEQLGLDATPLALAIVASYPTYMALGEGQYDLLWPLCIALFTCAWSCSSAWGRWPRTAAASFLFTFKPDLLLLLLVPAVAAWRRRVVQEAVVCLAVLAGVTVAVVGIPGLLRLPHIESYTLFNRYPPNLDETMLGFFWRTVGHGTLTQGLAWASLALALVVLSWAWLRNPPQSPRDWKLALSSTVCLSLLVAPHSLSHDLLLLAGPAVWTAAALKDSGRSLRWLAAWILLFNAAILIDGSPRVTLPVPITPIILLLAALVAWRARRTLAREPAGAVSEEAAGILARADHPASPPGSAARPALAGGSPELTQNSGGNLSRGPLRAPSESDRGSSPPTGSWRVRSN